MLTEDMADTHANYLRDLGSQLRADALEARGGDGEFARGRAFAYYEVLSLMAQQATAFGLELGDVGLDGLDPERDLLRP